jgi:hypothetical protein
MKRSAHTITNCELACFRGEIKVTQGAEGNDGCSLIASREVLHKLLDLPVLRGQVSCSLKQRHERHE